jgi:DNA-binding response OmpR family regulator
MMQTRSRAAEMAADPGTSTVPRLITLQPDVQPTELSVGDDGCMLGRASTCQVVVPRPLVSRLHAQIERDGARLRLRDLGSVNGTYVNGQRLHEPHLLAHLDLIGLGEPAAQLSWVDPDATTTSTARLRYDEREMRFFLGRRVVDLTPSQLRLLLHLYRHRGQVSTREQCAEAVWGADFPPGYDATALDRLLSTLRGTLRRVDPETRLIETRSGLGYRLTDDA